MSKNRSIMANESRFATRVMPGVTTDTMVPTVGDAPKATDTSRQAPLVGLAGAMQDRSVHNSMGCGACNWEAGTSGASAEDGDANMAFTRPQPLRCTRHRSTTPKDWKDT